MLLISLLYKFFYGYLFYPFQNVITFRKQDIWNIKEINISGFVRDIKLNSSSIFDFSKVERLSKQNIF